MAKLISAAKSFVKDEDGATMVEYAIMVALIAIVSIAVVTLVGLNVSRVFGVVNDSLTAIQ
jgi:pilus assembly protein Flp/PilA